MDSVCNEVGPREPSKVCQSEIKCDISTDIEKEVAEHPAITEVQKQAVDAVPASSEMSRQDPGSVSDGRTKAKVPKPGKTSGSYGNC